MSPIIPIGSLGYDDYQRTLNWDASGLYGLHRPASAGTDSSPVLPVTRYACVGIYAAYGTAGVINTLQWSADSGGLTPLGQFSWQTSPLIPDPLQMMFPNLGPYVQFDRVGILAAAWSGEGQMFATNRQHTLPVMPQNAVLINQQTLNVPANSSVAEYPSDYYAGPVTYWLAPPTAGWALSLQVLDSAGVWDTVFQVTGASISVVSGQIITPIGAWRLLLSNSTGAAGQADLVAIPSMTGST